MCERERERVSEREIGRKRALREREREREFERKRALREREKVRERERLGERGL